MKLEVIRLCTELRGIREFEVIPHISFWNHERVRERAPILNEKGVPLISISPSK